jgi:hypothetical protein
VVAVGVGHGCRLLVRSYLTRAALVELQSGHSSAVRARKTERDVCNSSGGCNDCNQRDLLHETTRDGNVCTASGPQNGPSCPACDFIDTTSQLRALLARCPTGAAANRALVVSSFVDVRRHCDLAEQWFADWFNRDEKGD